MAADPSLGELAYACVRALGPAVVVETGVATGVTSAWVLAALEDNGHGELHSIDLPPTELFSAGAVGSEIPDDVRGRWHYHWGGSRRLLPRVLEANTGQVSVFIHDSDHSYEHMRFELGAALEAVRRPGVIIADDIDLSDAFGEIMEPLGGFAVEQVQESGSTGILLLV